MSIFQIDSSQIYRVEPFLRLEWLEHGFGTRRTVNWPPPERLVNLKQIHSDIIFTAEANANGRLGEGDALISNQPGLMLGVRTADCEPILLVDPKQRAIAAVHAGWRGTADEILPKVVRRLMLEFKSDPADILAAIGPAIGECCYEVGPEVASRFCKFFPGTKRLGEKDSNQISLRRTAVSYSWPVSQRITFLPVHRAHFAAAISIHFVAMHPTAACIPQFKSCRDSKGARYTSRLYLETRN